MSDNLTKITQPPDLRMIASAGEPIEPQWNLIYNSEDDCHLAARLWLEAIHELRRRQLSTETDAAMLRRLISLRVSAELCQRHVAENGVVLRPKSSADVGLRNPYWAALRQAASEILKIEVELGLARPRPGQRHEPVKPPHAPRASDKYLFPKR